jgi:hypothetical protein
VLCFFKITDSSDDGWDPTLQYETNPIVSDSDDESNIIRTENRAIRKEKSKNKVTPRQNPSNHDYPKPKVPGLNLQDSLLP